jgi:murein DD-endopeptidase MepM/ murein hydrolase activator NlpD
MRAVPRTARPAYWRAWVLAGLIAVAACGAPHHAAGSAISASPSTAATAVTTGVSSRTLGYVFPVAGCSARYGRSHHDYPATDIFAARGCSYVAPVAGTIDEVSAVDTWSPRKNAGASRGGLSVSIIGVDGVRYYASHLDRIASGVRRGVKVTAGQRLGLVGDSGDARGRGTHVHFGISWPTAAGIWWVRRGEVYPWPYLDAWRAGRSLSPSAAVISLKRRMGTVPRCRVDC